MAWEMHQINPDPNHARLCAVQYYRGSHCGRALRWMLKGTDQPYAWAFYCDKHGKSQAERLNASMVRRLYDGRLVPA